MRINAISESNSSNMNFCAHVQKINQPEMRKIVGDSFSLKEWLSENISPFFQGDKVEIKELVKLKTGEVYANRAADILLSPVEKKLLDEEMGNVKKNSGNFSILKSHLGSLKTIVKSATVTPQELYERSLGKENHSLEDIL